MILVTHWPHFGQRCTSEPEVPLRLPLENRKRLTPRSAMRVEGQDRGRTSGCLLDDPGQALQAVAPSSDVFGRLVPQQRRRVSDLVKDFQRCRSRSYLKSRKCPVNSRRRPDKIGRTWLIAAKSSPKVVGVGQTSAKIGQRPATNGPGFAELCQVWASANRPVQMFQRSSEQRLQLSDILRRTDTSPDIVYPAVLRTQAARVSLESDGEHGPVRLGQTRVPASD